MLATGCTADSDAPAFDIPFDFKDSFYRANGIDPTKLINRLTPAHPSATTGTSIDPTRNSTRILHTFGGYDTVGEPLYYPLPPAPFKADAFLPNEQGKRPGEGDPGDTERGGRGPMNRDRVDIDADKANPELFRRDILEAMKRQGPAAYEEQVRQYYRELVK